MPSSLDTGYEMIEHDDDIVEVSRNPRRTVSSGSPSLDGSGDDEFTRPASDSELPTVAETDRLARQVCFCVVCGKNLHKSEISDERSVERRTRKRVREGAQTSNVG